MAMSIKSILAQAIKAIAKNPKLAILVVILKTLIVHTVTSSGVFAPPRSTSERIMAKLLAFHIQQVGDPNLDIPMIWHSLNLSLKDLMHVMVFLILNATFYFVLDIVTSIIAVHTVRMTRLAKQITNKGLISVVSKAWKRTAFTELLTTVLSLAFSGLLFCATAISGFLLYGSPVLLVAVPMLIMFLAAFCFLVNIMLVSNLARVISTVEDGSYGLAAVNKATKNLKGRKVQGFLLTSISICVLYTIVSISGISSATTSKNWYWERAILLLWDLVKRSVDWFCRLILTVFYLDCITNRDDDSLMAERNVLHHGYWPVKVSSD